jgi:hypothetical protein
MAEGKQGINEKAESKSWTSMKGVKEECHDCEFLDEKMKE